MPSYHSCMSPEQTWTYYPTSFRNFLLLLSLPCWAETIPALCLIFSSLLSALLSLSIPSTALQSCHTDHVFISQTCHAANTAPFAPSQFPIFISLHMQYFFLFSPWAQPLLYEHGSDGAQPTSCSASLCLGAATSQYPQPIRFALVGSRAQKGSMVTGITFLMNWFLPWP